MFEGASRKDTSTQTLGILSAPSSNRHTLEYNTAITLLAQCNYNLISQSTLNLQMQIAIFVPIMQYSIASYYLPTND